MISMIRKLLGLLILTMIFNMTMAAMPEGYFVSHAYLIKNYQMQDEDYNKRDFLSYILAENPAVELDDALAIVDGVIAVSNCFGIDAKLYLALIRMESNFAQKAISRTGAVGLSQFTSIGAQEVSDQLGQRGPNYANRKNTKYLNDIVNGCTLNWQQLWTRSSRWAEQKLFFLDDIQLSLIYGAILLKIYLAKNYNSDIETNYYDALVNYNGEPGERKYWYARTILKFYDEI